MLSVAIKDQYDSRKGRSLDNTSPEWISNQVYLASRNDKYSPMSDAESVITRAESRIKEVLESISKPVVSKQDIDNARMCYSFAARLARQTGSDEIRKSLRELDHAICEL